MLLIINSTISFIEENNAGQAAASLMARLAPKTKVFIEGFKLVVQVSTESLVQDHDVDKCFTLLSVYNHLYEIDWSNVPFLPQQSLVSHLELR